MAAKPVKDTGSSEKLSPVGKFALTFLCLLIIGGAYVIFLYDDLSTQIETARGKELNLRAQLKKAEESKEQYQKDLAEKIKREQAGREQKKMLPDDPETPAFLSSLQGAAIIAGVNLNSWSPMEQTPQEFYAKVPMKLTLSGKFHQIVKFFYNAGQLDRITNIENIQLKAVKAKNSPEISVSVECLATAFRAVRLEEAAAGNKKRGERR